MTEPLHLFLAQWLPPRPEPVEPEDDPPPPRVIYTAADARAGVEVPF